MNVRQLEKKKWRYEEWKMKNEKVWWPGQVDVWGKEEEEEKKHSAVIVERISLKNLKIMLHNMSDMVQTSFQWLKMITLTNQQSQNCANQQEQNLGRAFNSRRSKTA